MNVEFVFEFRLDQKKIENFKMNLWNIGWNQKIAISNASFVAVKCTNIIKRSYFQYCGETVMLTIIKMTHFEYAVCRINMPIEIKFFWIYKMLQYLHIILHKKAILFMMRMITLKISWLIGIL